MRQDSAVCALKVTAWHATGHGGIRSIMDDMTLLSTEAEGVNDTIPVSGSHSRVSHGSSAACAASCSELLSDTLKSLENNGP